MLQLQETASPPATCNGVDAGGTTSVDSKLQGTEVRTWDVQNAHTHRAQSRHVIGTEVAFPSSLRELTALAFDYHSSIANACAPSSDDIYIMISGVQAHPKSKNANRTAEVLCFIRQPDKLHIVLATPC